LSVKKVFYANRKAQVMEVIYGYGGILVFSVPYNQGLTGTNLPEAVA